MSTRAQGDPSEQPAVGGALPLTVAIPTRNSGVLVIEALGTICKQLEPGDEVVVVDDGSTDDTADRIETWLAAAWPAGRVVRQPHQGVSATRNAGLDAARTEVVCFFDDDQFADESWLSNLRSAWRRLGPRVGAVGGPMRPLWPIPRPAWLDDGLLHVVSALDLGDAEHQLDQTPFTGYLWGGNMSLRKAATDEVGGFDSRVGYGPDRTLAVSRGEDEEIQDRLARGGWDVWYVPAAAVDHRITEERLRPARFRRVYRRSALIDLAAGKSRAGGLSSIARSGARVPLSVVRRGRGELVRAGFEFTYGFTRLVGQRPNASS
jgi:glycosyltransferase involved in cell wall biosynthesis